MDSTRNKSRVSKPSARSVLPNKEAIRGIRKQRGMTQEAFADIVDVSLTTLQKLEAGAAVDIQTLKNVAQKLTLPYKNLVAPNHNIPPDITEFREKVSLKLETDDETTIPIILNHLAELINSSHEIFIIGIKRGSLIVEIDLHPVDFLMLLRCEIRGELKWLGIKEVVIVPGDIHLNKVFALAQSFVGRPNSDEPSIQQKLKDIADGANFLGVVSPLSESKELDESGPPQ